MKFTIFTIGFTKKTAEEFFRLLEGASVQKLIDIRENRVGQLSGFAKYPDIEFLLKRLLNIQYVHEPLFAPSPPIREAYRKSKDWAAYEKSFLELMEERKMIERATPELLQGNVALLCSEDLPDKCHRRLLAERFAQHLIRDGHPVEVKHLVIERPKSPRKPPKRKQEKWPKSYYLTLL